MKNLVALVLIVSLSPAWACDLQEKEFRQITAQLPVNCERDQDCALADLAWNPCRGAIPVAKAGLDDKGLEALRFYRSQLWKRCGFVVPPCAAVPQGQPYCFEKRCDMTLPHGEVSARIKLPEPGQVAENDGPIALVLVDLKSRNPVKNKEVTLTAKDTIYCVTAPCPQPPPHKMKIKTSAGGVLVVPLIGADNLLELAGFSPRTFQRDQLKKLDGRKIGFQPKSQ